MSPNNRVSKESVILGKISISMFFAIHLFGYNRQKHLLVLQQTKFVIYIERYRQTNLKRAA